MARKGSVPPQLQMKLFTTHAEIERAVDVELVEDLVKRIVLDANHEIGAHGAKVRRQPLPGRGRQLLELAVKSVKHPALQSALQELAQHVAGTKKAAAGKDAAKPKLGFLKAKKA